MPALAGADDGILAVGSSLALKAQGILEIKSDDCVSGVLEQEVAQRADGDDVGDGSALDLGSLRVARVNLRARGGFQPVQKIVGLDAQAPPAAHLDETALGILRGELISHFLRAAWRERHNLVAEVH